MTRAAWLCVVLASGCLAKSATLCDNGTVCPSDRVCVPDGCALADQVAACNGLADQAPCSYANLAGTCLTGICYADLCGNDALDPGETCDGALGIDAAAGQHCSGDCQRVESCGNGIVESDIGEQCDDANANPADGCDACVSTIWNARAVVSGHSLSALDVPFVPSAVAVDAVGNLYICDRNAHRILEVDATTNITTVVAGTGLYGFSGDGGAAIGAQLSSPSGLAVDGLGNIYIADAGNDRIRRVDAQTGIITTVAGNGNGDSGDGGPATNAALQSVDHVAVDGLGNLFFAANGRIRKVDASTRILTTVATNLFGNLALDGLNSLYVADSYNRQVVRVELDSGIIIPVAGTGTFGASGDGGPATEAELGSPNGLAVDAAGNLYIADGGDPTTFDYGRIRVVNAITHNITTFAGTGVPGYSGDGGPASNAQFAYPSAVAMDRSGNVFVADTNNNVVRRVDGTSTIITTFAGTGLPEFLGDGGAATSAILEAPGIAVDTVGNVYIADAIHNRIRRVDAGTGVITTIAGTGMAGYSGDGGSATAARLDTPFTVAVDSAGNVYIGDNNNFRIRRVTATTGMITTVAGTGEEGFSTNVLAIGAKIGAPNSIAIDAAGNLYFADFTCFCVRTVDAGTGLLTTVAGNGVGYYSGDDGPAASAGLWAPRAIALDAQGNLYIADFHRLRRVDSITHLITTIAGFGTPGFSGDGGLARYSQLSPTSVAVDPTGNLLVVEGNRIRLIDTTGVLTTIAGTDTPGFTGDGGPAGAAQLSPNSVVAGADGLYVAGAGNVRHIDLANNILTIAGAVGPPGMGPMDQASFADPRAIVVAPPFTFVAGGASGTVQALREDVGRVEAVAGRYSQFAPTGNLARFRESSFAVQGVEGVAYDATERRIFFSSSSAIAVVTVVDPDDANTWTFATLYLPVGTLRAPSGLYLDQAAHVLYLADRGNHVVLRIDLSGGLGNPQVTTLAGTMQTRGFDGDGGAATDALFNAPRAITRCPNGDLYVADTGNHRVRRIAAGTGLVTTVLGNGFAASSGEGTPASSFPVDTPLGLACDAAGDLFVTSRTTVRLLPWASDAQPGLVDGFGPVETIYGRAPHPTFPVTYCLTGLAVVDPTTVRVTDSCAGVLVELTRDHATP